MKRLCQASSLIDAHPHPMLGLRTAVEVGDVELVLVGEREQEIVLQRGECCRIHRLVAIVPPDRRPRSARRLTVNLSLRAAAGVLAGADHQRPVLGEQALAAPHRMLDQRRGRQIPEDLGLGGDALRFKTDAGTRSVTDEYPLFQMSKAAAAGVGPAAASYARAPIGTNRRAVKTALALLRRCSRTIALTSPARRCQPRALLAPPTAGKRERQ